MRRSPSQLTSLPRFSSMLVAVLFILLSPVGSVAGDVGQCSSTRAANDLLQCEACKQFKQLTRNPSVRGLSFQVHALEHGVVVQIDGRSKEQARFVRDLAHAVWSSQACEGHLCSYCEDRLAHIVEASVDEASTETGIIMVLTSEDSELSAWLRKDAEQMQQFAMRAAGSD